MRGTKHKIDSVYRLCGTPLLHSALLMIIGDLQFMYSSIHIATYIQFMLLRNNFKCTASGLKWLLSYLFLFLFVPACQPGEKLILYSVCFSIIWAVSKFNSSECFNVTVVCLSPNLYGVQIYNKVECFIFVNANISS